MSIGPLPLGLHLSSDGKLTGTPLGTPGTFVVGIRCTDNAAPTPNTAEVNVTIVISGVAILTDITHQPYNAIYGQQYGFQFVAAGGTPPYLWHVESGSSLPPGLSLSASGPTAGWLTGIPTVPGTYTFTLGVTDSGGSSTATATFTTQVVIQVVFTNGNPPSNVVAGVAYNFNFVASGGIAPYTYTVVAGGIPAGLTLDTSGLLHGVPTTNKLYHFTIQAQDAQLNVATHAYAIQVI